MRQRKWMKKVDGFRKVNDFFRTDDCGSKKVDEDEKIEESYIDKYYC